MKIPQLDVTNLDLPVVVENGNIEVGVPEGYLSEPINNHIRKYEGRIRDTDLEKVDLTNLKFSLAEGAFVVKGDVEVQFKKLLSEAPIVGAVYTPWITINGSFIEELTVKIVNGKLNVSHSELALSTNDSGYKKLFDNFVLPYLEKEVVKLINEQLSNFNDLSIEELAWKYGQAKLKEKLGDNVLNEDRINGLLKLANTGVNRFDRLRQIKNKLVSMGINARVSEKHLWLSIFKR